MTIGRSDTATMPMVTSEKFSFTIGTLPNSSPAPRHRPTQRDRADDVVEDERRARHLRRAGDERARTSARSARSGRGSTALPPYCSKNSCARFRWSRFSQPVPAPVRVVGAKTLRPDAAGRSSSSPRRRRTPRRPAARRRPACSGAGRAERAGGEQQRVAGQKRRDDDAGLGEDDREQNRVDPRAVGADEVEQMPVEVEKEVDDSGHLDRVERLGEVLLQIVDVLDARRNADQAVGDAEWRRGARPAPTRASSSPDGRSAFRRRRGSRRAPSAARAFSSRRGRFERPELERQHAAEAAHLPLRQRVLRMRRQARVVDALHLGVRGQELARAPGRWRCAAACAAAASWCRAAPATNRTASGSRPRRSGRTAATRCRRRARR